MCQDLQDRLANVTSERDTFTYQSEALIAARAALAQDFLAIDSLSEEEPEECTNSDSDHLGFRPESVTAERDEMIDGLQELLLARAALADLLLAADASLVIEEHSLDSLPVVHEDSEVLALGYAADAPRAEKGTRFADLVDLVVIGEEEEKEEIAPPSYDESNDDSDISFSCLVEDKEMWLNSFVDSPPCFTSSDDDMSMCSSTLCPIAWHRLTTGRPLPQMFPIQSLTDDCDATPSFELDTSMISNSRLSSPPLLPLL